MLKGSCIKTTAYIHNIKRQLIKSKSKKKVVVSTVVSVATLTTLYILSTQMI